MDIRLGNLALRFIVEVCTLVALGYWGFHSAKSALLRVVLGVGAPLLVAVVWGMFGAPQASYALTGWTHLLLEITVFAVGAAALYASGRTTLAWVFGIVVILNRCLMFVWDQ